MQFNIVALMALVASAEAAFEKYCTSYGVSLPVDNNVQVTCRSGNAFCCNNLQKDEYTTFRGICNYASGWDNEDWSDPCGSGAGSVYCCT